MLARHERNDQYLRRVLWTDESTFTRDGTFNCHNDHWYAQENPHVTKINKSQHRFQVMVWGGIVDRIIIGPVFFEHNVNGENYTRFLNEQLWDLLDEIPLHIIRDLTFMHDGAPGHYAASSRRWLDQNFPDHWIGRLGPTAWPARSPDLTAMDFFVWGAIKDFVYKVRINTQEQLRERIVKGFDDLRDKIQNIDIIEGTVRRFQTCIEQNGGHIENFLQ
jgi:hypothetical protein